MLQLVNVGRKSLADYASLATRGLMDEIRRLAEPLSGERVAHVSATAFGGGVAEINYTLIPLMQYAGLVVEWRILGVREEVCSPTTRQGFRRPTSGRRRSTRLPRRTWPSRPRTRRTSSTSSGSTSTGRS